MRLDPHSYNDTDQPEVAKLSLIATVNFAEKILEASAYLELREPMLLEGPLDLDTRGLTIESVEAIDFTGRKIGEVIQWQLDPPEPILGSRLHIWLPVRTLAVEIEYRSSPDASALQWLDPQQTAGKRHPFLFSQCQAIHARSVVPLQDTPRIRITYHARLTVPRELRGLMAASFIERKEEATTAVEQWEMPQPIPPYLFALAVGDLQSRDLGPRSRVWAEPSVVDAAAHEFAGVDEMITAAERLFGPYDWDRFDILTMPPSFPYGGMENPRLTFLTPTLLAGDRSLVHVVAHELAHSWTGNLISNASAEHVWLNEGWTVFAERRIVEAIEGPEALALQAVLGRRSLEHDIGEFAAVPELTRLRTRLAGVDPDQVFSRVPYEKGYLFLRALEEAAGRARFDEFIQAYVSAFRFRSITTGQFLEFVEQKLPGVLAAVDSHAWVDGEGVPANEPVLRSARLDEIEGLAHAGSLPTGPFSPTEWQLYLESIPRPAQKLCAALDAAHRLSESTNAEVLAAWLVLALDSEHAPAVSAAEAFLARVGRLKYLRPIYKVLASRPDTLDLARAAFERNVAHYHPLARAVIPPLLR
jgi:leukotriene-A4 hydrolase